MTSNIIKVWKTERQLFSEETGKKNEDSVIRTRLKYNKDSFFKLDPDTCS